LAGISALASNEKSAKSSLAAAALIDKAPSAVAKLKGQGGLVSALTLGKTSSITARHFKAPLKAGLKSSMAKLLESLIAAQPLVLAAVVAPLADPAGAAPAANALAAAAPAAAAAAALSEREVRRRSRPRLRRCG